MVSRTEQKYSAIFLCDSSPFASFCHRKGILNWIVSFNFRIQCKAQVVWTDRIYCKCKIKGISLSILGCPSRTACARFGVLFTGSNLTENWGCWYFALSGAESRNVGTSEERAAVFCQHWTTGGFNNCLWKLHCRVAIKIRHPTCYNHLSAASKILPTFCVSSGGDKVLIVSGWYKKKKIEKKDKAPSVIPNFLSYLAFCFCVFVPAEVLQAAFKKTKNINKISRNK